MAKQQTAVMGLDPSIASTGLRIEGENYWASYSLPEGSRKLKGDQRLVGLREELELHLTKALIEGYPVEFCVMEDLPKQAQGAGLTGRAQGVVREVLSRREIFYAALAPATLKKAATGSGRADKDEMTRAVPGELQWQLRNSDEVDAYWLAQCALGFLGRPNALADPSALDKYR